MLLREVYDLRTLPPAERARLAERIHPVIRQVSPCESLADLVTDYGRPAEVMKVAVYSEAGEPVACARYRIVRIPPPDPCDVLRLDVTVRRTYYGRIPFVSFFLGELLRRRDPARLPLFGLFLCASPASYYLLARTCPSMVPAPGRLQGPADHRVSRLAGAFGLPMVPGRPGVVRLWDRGFIESPEERAAWFRHPSPLVRFFLARCPAYADGEALAAGLRLTPSVLLAAAARHAAHRALRATGLTTSFRRRVLDPTGAAAPPESAPEAAGEPSE